LDRGRVDLTVHERSFHLLRDLEKVALDRIEASTPFLRWLRKTGMAMAARMPMDDDCHEKLDEGEPVLTLVHGPAHACQHGSFAPDLTYLIRSKILKMGM